MFHFLLLLVLPFTSQQQSVQDSLHIHSAYKNSIEMLKTTNDYKRWYVVSDSLERVTARALHRLSVYNHEEYEPALKHNREGFGETYYFPAPVTEIVVEPSRAKSFTIMDHQTKFITKGDGKTKIPYIERLHFDESHHLLKVDKVNPAIFYTEGLVVCYE